MSVRATSTTGHRSRRLALSRPTTSARQRSAPARRSCRWSGSVRGISCLLSRDPVVDFRTFFSNRGILLNYDLPGQPAGANAFGVSYQRVDLDTASGWTNVPASYSPAMQEQFKVTNTAFPATDNVDRFYDLYIYDSTDDGQVSYDQVLAVDSAAAKNGASAAADLAAGEWADIKVDADRRARRPDRRLLPQGDRHRPRPLDVPRLLHLDRPRQRDLQRARRGRVRGVRGDACSRLPDLDGRRLRAARGRHRRRGHVHRAGREVGGRPSRLPRLHPRRPRRQPEPPPARQPDHRRGPAPVPGADGARRHGRRPEPVLRRRHERQHPRRPRRDSLGLHPRRIPRGRRNPRPRALAHGLEHDRHGLVRPRLRAAVVRRERREDPGRRRDHRRREHQQLSRSRGAGSGPRPAGPAGPPRSTSTSPGEIRAGLYPPPTSTPSATRSSRPSRA